MSIQKRIRSKAISMLYEVTYKINPVFAGNLMYRRAFHRNMNLENPHNLIEKIYWLQFKSDTSMWTKCADKFRMREYVEECGLGEYLPKLYGHWDNPEDIDFGLLPNEFVLKANNGCHTVDVITDKTKIDFDSILKKLKCWIKKPYGYEGGQSHYLRIKPCIIAEELLHQDEDQYSFSPESMVDYKVWCLNGEPESILVVYGRKDSVYSLDLYNTDWKRISDNLKKNGLFIFREEPIPQPRCLGKMITMAKVLSKPFPEVRVDFYVVEGEPVIGELTFSTGYGYFTDEYYDYLGGKIDLGKILQN